MGGISIWQLLIILLIIGILVVMYLIISSGSKGDIQRPLKFFIGAFGFRLSERCYSSLWQDLQAILTREWQC